DVVLQSMAADSDPKARETVLALARAEDPNLRVPAIVALLSARVPEVSPIAREELLRADVNTQLPLLAAAGETGDPAYSPVLAELAQGPWPIRSSALGALGKLGGSEATKVLIAIMASGAPQDVSAAAAALAESGDEMGRKALLDAAHSSRPSTARAA